VSTYALTRFMDWLADESEQGKHLSDRTVANAVIPLRAALATAKREGLIRHNPAQGLAMPHRELLKREVRLPPPLVARLRAHLAAQPNQHSTALAFPSEAGTPLAPSNLRRRVLKPLVEEVDASWVVWVEGIGR